MYQGKLLFINALLKYRNNVFAFITRKQSFVIDLLKYSHPFIYVLYFFLSLAPVIPFKSTMRKQQMPFTSQQTTRRYEIESDAHRESNACEIGRRYLGVMEIKAIDQENEKTESNNINQNNVSSPKNNSQITEKADGQSMHGSDLVTEILNEELIQQVREKIHSKYIQMYLFVLEIPVHLVVPNCFSSVGRR